MYGIESSDLSDCDSKFLPQFNESLQTPEGSRTHTVFPFIKSDGNIFLVFKETSITTILIKLLKNKT